MKKELLAFIAMILLVIGAIGSQTHLNKLISTLNTHIEYSLLYCSLDDYDAARTEMSKVQNIWNNAENYTNIFIRHNEIDGASDIIYDALSAIENREKYEAEYHLKKLRYHANEILQMEKITIGGVF